MREAGGPQNAGHGGAVGRPPSPGTPATAAAVTNSPNRTTPNTSDSPRALVRQCVSQGRYAQNWCSSGANPVSCVVCRVSRVVRRLSRVVCRVRRRVVCCVLCNKCHVAYVVCRVMCRVGP